MTAYPFESCTVEPKINLATYTHDAVDILIFAKNTRISMSVQRMWDIRNMSREEKEAELDYIAATIPASWEFVHYVFIAENVSRNFTQQLTRTRTGSYAQESLNVTDQSDFDFCYTQKNKESERDIPITEHALRSIRETYRELLAKGTQREDARGILPLGISTRIVFDFNLRTLADFLRTRIGGRNNDETTIVAKLMAQRVLEVHPWAEKFIYSPQRDFYADIERFAADRLYSQPELKRELLKIVDMMRRSEADKLRKGIEEDDC